MLSVRTNTPKPAVRMRRPTSTIAPIAHTFAALATENQRLKRKNAQLKVALATAVIEHARRRK